MTWNIVSDSSCDLKSSDLEATSLSFQVVPMRIQVGGHDYLDDENLNIPMLLNEMAAEKAASSSACPSPAAFAHAFETGVNTICFTISSNLSGTYNSAVLARNLVLEEHPEKKICVIDSKSTAGVMILLIRKAKELICAGSGDFEGICNALRIYQSSLRTLFTLENFDNLIKNGRMRPLVGSLLHTLGIHVIAEATPKGTIHVAEKSKGEAKTYRAMTALMAQSKDCTGAQVFISHCENLRGALKLKEQILADLPVKDVSIVGCRGLTSFYAMEKGLILGY